MFYCCNVIYFNEFEPSKDEAQTASFKDPVLCVSPILFRMSLPMDVRCATYSVRQMQQASLTLDGTTSTPTAGLN